MQCLSPVDFVQFILKSHNVVKIDTNRAICTRIKLASHIFVLVVASSK